MQSRIVVAFAAVLAAVGCNSTIGNVPELQTGSGDDVVSCSDGQTNGAETDVDCGGPECAPCGLGLVCAATADCDGGVCEDSACAHPRSCGSLHAQRPGIADGVYTVDPDGPEGQGTPFQAYCDMSTAGGGWQLVSVVTADEPTAVIVSASSCTDLSTEVACKGHLPVEHVATSTQILVRSLTSVHWLVYGGFSASPSSALRYFSLEQVLTSSDSCEGTHVCRDGDKDPSLAVVATSGFTAAHNPPLYQWWRFGGWWVGADPGAAGLDGNIHSTSYDTFHVIRERLTPDGESNPVDTGAQALFYRYIP